MRQILDEAHKGGYGVGAFNIGNMEQLQAVMEAARETNSPVIVQVSRGARKYAGDAFIRHLVLAAVETYPEIPFALHQDHGNGPAVCESAIKLGFTSVMMDGSLKEDGKTPSDFEYNVAVTRQVVEMAHAQGVTVEGELGCIGSLETGEGEKEDGHGFSGKLTRDALLTNPEQAVEFVRRTGIDALAVAIGTSHGAYKFTREPDEDILAIDRIREIHEMLPGVHLVMHGSSSVPQEILQTINSYGGQIKPTWGVPLDKIALGIVHGIRKINVDTDGRLAITGALRQFFAEKPAEFDPRGFLQAAKEAMKEVVKARMLAFGQAGHAGDFAPIPLEEMAKRY